MSRFNTGNPLGSNDPRDLDDNAKNMDLAVNSDALQWVDRLDRNRKTFAGMESEFQSAQESRSDRFNDFIASSGYQFVGDYGPGIEISEYNQLIRDSNGEFWRVSGQVELPYVTTGAGIPEDDALVPAGDAVLRQELGANTPGQGSDLITHTGTTDTVTEALNKRTTFVASIADLINTVDLVDGAHYSVSGYHPDSDVGGGVFYWDSNISKAEHNGGNVIDPSRIFPIDWSDDAQVALWFEAGGVGNGCFIKTGNGEVFVEDFGAISGGVFDVHRSVQAAAQQSEIVNFSPETYLYNGTVSITSKTKFICSSVATFNFNGNTVTPFISTSASDYVAFEGIKFNASVAPQDVAPVAVQTINSQNVYFDRCEIINCRVRGENDTSLLLGKFMFLNSKIQCDFSLYDITVTQNDALTIRGFREVVIHNNDISLTNVFRGIKIQTSTLVFPDGYADATTSPDFVYITNNKVSGSTTSAKQLVDLHTVRGKLTLVENNVVSTTGFGAVFENKTNRSNSETSSFDVYSKNKIKCDNWAIFYEAQRGNTANSGQFAMGERHVVINENEIVVDSALTTARGIQVRYCETAQIKDNPNISLSAGTNAQMVEMGGNACEIFSGNSMVGGYVMMVDATGSHQGDAHIAKTDTINVSDNCFMDCSNPLQGFVVFRDLNNASMNVTFSGNVAKNDVATAFAGGIAAIRDVTAYSFAANSNAIKQVSAVDERIFKSYPSISIDFYTEFGNSWDGAALNV